MKLDEIHESMFTATKWDRADVKFKYAKRLCRFLERRCPKKSWNKAFYNRLMQMFGFIAHYSVDGFWDSRLKGPVERLRTVEAILNHPCHGMPDHTWCDVERVVQRFVTENGLRPIYETAAQEAVEATEKTELERLQAKYSS